MSQTSIPNMTQNASVSKKETIAMLIKSVAMSEISMSHLISAEAEKIQSFVRYSQEANEIKTRDFLQFNHSVAQFLEQSTMEQWLNLNKLDRAIHLLNHHLDDSHVDLTDDEVDI